MSPVVERINEDAYKPYAAGTIDAPGGARQGPRAAEKKFMLDQTRESDHRDLRAHLRRQGLRQHRQDVPLMILVPSFVTSELKTSFLIGFSALHSVRDHRSRGRERADCRWA